MIFCIRGKQGGVYLQPASEMCFWWGAAPAIVRRVRELRLASDIGSVDACVGGEAKTFTPFWGLIND